METVDQCGCGNVAFGMACGLKYLLPPVSTVVTQRAERGPLAPRGSTLLSSFTADDFPQLRIPSVGGEQGQIWIWWGGGISSHAAGVCLSSQWWNTELLWQDRPSSFQSFFFYFIFTFSDYLTDCCCFLRNTYKGKEVAFFSAVYKAIKLGWNFKE